MTNEQKGSLAFSIRLSGASCNAVSETLTAWLAEHPGVDANQARSFAGMCHGVPFPSIRGRKEGPFPVYPDRPYYDARARDGIELVATIVDACGHERCV